MLTFNGFAHAEANHNHDEANHNHDEANHNHDEANHNHDEANHNHGELTEYGDIGVMYIPCPVADPNPHYMVFMSSYEVYQGQTGSYHYHGNRYCVAELYKVRSLYSCKYCGWDEWKESSRIVHPGL